MTNAQAVGPFRYKRKSWAIDFIAVLIVCGIIYAAWHSHFDAKARLAQAVAERDFALDEQARVEVALAELRQSLHGCLNAGGMTTVGKIDNVNFVMACKRVKGL
jgi:archaellum component FlaF (FlaF/FlaG flagellin family)